MEQGNEEKEKLKNEQKQKIKMFAFCSAAVVLCIVIILFIFQPTETENEQQTNGVNTNIPNPDNEEMNNDKRSIYQKDYKKNQKKDEDKKREQMMMNADTYMNGGENDTTQIRKEEELDLLNPKEQEEQTINRYGGSGGNPNNAYRNINHTLETFYESPDKANVEREEMKAQIEELQEQLAITKQDPKTNSLDDQMALLEKSYELASKNNNSSVQTSTNSNTVTSDNESKEIEQTDKATIIPIGNIPKQIVSMLHQPMSDSTFIAKFTQEHNAGFNTAVGTQVFSDVNTIKACINDTKSVVNGENVRLRLLEAMRVGRYIIPKNTLLTGVAQMAGERLIISITSIEYKGMIIHVNLAIFDTDGQEGIFIPNSMEVSALKEIGANMGTTLGSSINISTDAGAQLVSDVGKGLIQGTSKYITKKIQIVKVHLKADYKVLLYQKKN